MRGGASDMLENRICVVTGAAQGIGLALVRKLVACGAKVAMLDIDEAGLAEAASELFPDRVLAITADVSSEAQMESAAAKIQALWGPISIWVNNAGLARHRPIADVRGDELDLMFAVNFKGTVFGSKMALKAMAPQRKGHIVNVISTAGLRGIAGQSIYCASKFAVRGFTEALQDEAAPYRVKVTAVYPGGVNTAFWQTATDRPPPSNILLDSEQVANGIISVLKTDDICMIKELVIRSVHDADTLIEAQGKGAV